MFKVRRQQKHEAAPKLRAVAVLAASFVLVAQASGLGHLLLVQHSVCPQHGELIHVGEATTHPATVAAVAPSDDDVAGLTTDEGDAADSHERCTLLAERRERLLLRAPSSGLAVLALLSQRHAPPAELSHAPQVPLLRVAPKSSPTV